MIHELRIFYDIFGTPVFISTFNCFLDKQFVSTRSPSIPMFRYECSSYFQSTVHENQYTSIVLDLNAKLDFVVFCMFYILCSQSTITCRLSLLVTRDSLSFVYSIRDVKGVKHEKSFKGQILYHSSLGPFRTL